MPNWTRGITTYTARRGYGLINIDLDKNKRFARGFLIVKSCKRYRSLTDENLFIIVAKMNGCGKAIFLNARVFDKLFREGRPAFFKPHINRTPRFSTWRSVLNSIELH